MSRSKKRWVKRKGEAKEPCQEVRVLLDRRHWERGRREVLGWCMAWCPPRDVHIGGKRQCHL